MILERIVSLLYLTGWIWCFIEWRNEYRITHKADGWIELAVFLAMGVLWLPFVISLLVAVVFGEWIYICRRVNGKIRHHYKNY